MRHNVSLFCITGKKITVARYSRITGDFLRKIELTLTIGELTTLERIIYLMCINQLAEIGCHALVIKE
jgi:hypothetical protein